MRPVLTFAVFKSKSAFFFFPERPSFSSRFFSLSAFLVSDNLLSGSERFLISVETISEDIDSRADLKDVDIVAENRIVHDGNGPILSQNIAKTSPCAGK